VKSAQEWHVYQPVVNVQRRASGRSAPAADSAARAGRRRGGRAVRAAAAAAARRVRARRLRRRARLLAPAAHGGAVLGVPVALRGACGGAASAGAAAAALPAHLRRRPRCRPAGAGAACYSPSATQHAPHGPEVCMSVAPGWLPRGLREALCVRGAMLLDVLTRGLRRCASVSVTLPYPYRARSSYHIPTIY